MTEKVIKVLVVDDIALIRKEIKLLLPKKEIISVVGECSDGKEVLAFLKNNEVDVVLMDVTMRYIGGIDATTLVKKTYPKIKIMAFSSHTEDIYKSRMLQAGASDYIVKGTNIGIIREKIKKLIDISQT